MKRREFVKALGIGLSGLAGFERLIRAMSGQPSLSAIAICAISQLNVGSSGFNCLDFYCRSNFNCGSDNNSVSCNGVYEKEYNFGCTNFQCQSGFTCYDFQCKQGASGDFDCHNTFECARQQSYAQFSCDGSDSFNAQFNCHQLFTCYGGVGQRVWCEDFWCDQGDFTCYPPFSCSSNNYDCDANFSCTPSWTCQTNPYHN